MSRAPYIDSSDTKLCSGCAACAFVCPTSAISMREDLYGFVYPLVEEDICVACGKCGAVCHMSLSDELKSNDVPVAYGAYHRDVDALRRSASGGIATLLSRQAVVDGGVAYGCVAHREVVRHERLATVDELELARGSKYVQSDISDIFAQVVDDLDAGREVAFVGTPCQCAALRSLFGEYNNLFLVDLVCEGVPSARMYADFLDDLERERGERIEDFRFRDKRGGWSTKNAVVVGKGGKPLDKQPHSYYYYYYWLFAHALILRDSCYTCPYASSHRVGDVTVGDLWGAETAGASYGMPELRSGISCVLVSTSRGAQVLKEAENALDLRKVSFETTARSNSCLCRPSSCDTDARAAVLFAYMKRGADGMKAEYQRLFGHASRIKAKVSSRAPLEIRVVVKKAFCKLRIIGRRTL